MDLNISLRLMHFVLLKRRVLALLSLTERSTIFVEILTPGI